MQVQSLEQTVFYFLNSEKKMLTNIDHWKDEFEICHQKWINLKLTDILVFESFQLNNIAAF